MITLLMACVLCAQQEPQVATIQLPDDVFVTDSLPVDIDGDARTDLAIACRHEPTGRRSIRVYRRRPNGPAFVSQPHWPPYDVDRDSVAFAFCDCRPAPGPELLLLSPELVAVVERTEAGFGEVAMLCEHTLVWPAADPQRLLPLPNASLDFDGDGDDDLLLPRPDGWSVWLQRQRRFETQLRRDLPPRANPLRAATSGSAFANAGGQISVRLGGIDVGRNNLVDASTRTPRCHVADLDGDGRSDLAAVRSGTLHASLQDTRGALTASDRALPLPENRLKIVDPAFDVQFEDINGDGRADLLLTTSARRDNDVEARVDWYLARADGWWATARDGRLRLQAFATPATLVDVDGDGRRDLVCVSMRTSSMRSFTGEATTVLDAQLSIFRNDGTGFARPAMLNRPVPLVTGEDRLQLFLRAQPGADGKPGFLLARTDGAIERRPLERRGERLRMRRQDARVPIADDAQIDMMPDAGELLIRSDHEIRHVRFR